MNKRVGIIGAVIAVGLLLLAVFSSGLYSSNLSQSDSQRQMTDQPSIVGTIPENLDQATILPNQTLEIHFSQPLENEPETKWNIEGGADIKASVSEDKKTLKLTPNKPFDLGKSFTLFIKGETKFEGKKTLDHEYQFHFKTIEFKGA